MLSTDGNILKRAGSEVGERMIDYGTIFDELHIILYTRASEAGENLTLAPNVFVYPTRSTSRPKYLADAFRIAKAIIGARGFTSENSFVTAQDPFETALVGWRIKKKIGIPLQIQVHTDFLTFEFWRESFKNFLRMLLGRFLIKKADRVRVVSERIEGKLAGIGMNPNLMTVLPVFIDIQKLKSAPAAVDLHAKYPTRFVILMASRLTKEKNIPLGLRAVSALLKDASLLGAKPFLFIVGEGPEKGTIESEIRRLGLSESAVVEGWSDNLAGYYKTANLFLLTSNYEGYARTVIEAAALGCPVVMTNVGCAGEVIRDGRQGFVVGVKDLKGLTTKLKTIIENPGILRNLELGDRFVAELPSKADYLEHYKKSLLR